MRKFSRASVLVGLVTLVLGCEGAEPLPDALDLDVSFDSGTARIETATDTIRLRVEIAETDRQRRLGLMRRTSLAPDAGMIFLFQEQQPASGSFYMYNTLIPLSIAFLDADGRIGNIRDMQPCPSPNPNVCLYYEARVPFMAALEVNLGYFSRRGISVGDRVVLERNGAQAMPISQAQEGQVP